MILDILTILKTKPIIFFSKYLVYLHINKSPFKRFIEIINFICNENKSCQA